MAFIAFLLLAAGIADLVRGTPDMVSSRRAFLAAASGAIPTASLAALSGFSPLGTVAVAASLTAVLSVWGTASDGDDSKLARVHLALVVLVLLTALAVGASAPDLGADLKRWYESLPLDPAAKPPLAQFVTAVAVFVYVIASANRVVRLILKAANAQIDQGEEALKGGRWLGALERLLVVGVVLAGEPTGAAVIIAAKGIVRIPEVTRAQAEDAKDQTRAVTEYFLIGTLSSLLVATALAGLVLGTG